MRRRQATILAAAAAACLLVSAGAARAAAVDGDGMWIWYVSSSSGGTPAAIAAQAARHGVSTVYVKAADSGSRWSQFSRPFVRALQARGLEVCAWQFVYGNYPIGEAAAGAAAKRAGADCLVIDAEGDYEGKYVSAQIYMKRLRRQVGPEFELALTSFPYVHFHPGLPYSVFLGPGGAQYNLPQMYWKDIGVSVDEIYGITWTYNSVYGRPIYPLGQTYSNPASWEVRRFRRLAASYGASGLSWWVWQFSGARQWNALGSPFDSIGQPPRRDTVPLLRRGARSDLVVWAQQHLLELGLVRKVTGNFGGGTQRAVRRFQREHALPVTGEIDTATWPVLLPTGPAPVRWSTARRYARPAGHAGAPQPMPEPLNAREPARRNEIAGKPGS